MIDYITFIWNPMDTVSENDAARFGRLVSAMRGSWTCASRLPGMTLYTTPLPPPMKVYLFPSNAGVLIGRLFASESAGNAGSRDAQLAEADIRRILDTGGRALTDLVWGGYLAVLHYGFARGVALIRDVSGMIPCYTFVVGRLTIAFSNVENLLSLPLPPFQINHTYLAAFIHSSELQVNDCGLSGVQELGSGECLQISGGGTARRSVLWDPRRVWKDRPAMTYEEAITQLRCATDRVISSWASVFERILHRLSGGFDSAVVLGCLATASRRPEVTCFNTFGKHTGEDERRYARLAAQKAHVPLLEYCQDAGEDTFSKSLLCMPLAPKPSVPAMFFNLNTRPVDRAAQEQGVQAIWTGQGGDHLFWNTVSSLSASDFVFECGMRRGLIDAIRDAARYSREPYLTVAGAAWKSAFRKTKCIPDNPVLRSGSFSNADLLPKDMPSYTAHPWIESVEQLPKGKQCQVFYLWELLNRQRPLLPFTRPQEYCPLVSQPIIELCLQIPLYLLIRGGRQRALARDAFRTLIPPEIYRREDKGDITATLVDSLRASEHFVRETLLDGYLLKERIVDSKKLVPYLERGSSVRWEHTRPLLACLAAEVWARSWIESSLRVAA